jgi:hypothetical protein
VTDVRRRPSELPILIELACDIDIGNAATLGDCLCQAMELTGGGLVVDMTAVSLVIPPGMEMMVEVHVVAISQRRTVTWARCSIRSREIFAAVGLDQLLIFDE